MTWTRPAPDRIESAAGTVLREGGSYFAFGPEKSQDVDWIAESTAAELRTKCNHAATADQTAKHIRAGCAVLGMYKTADEAKRACIEYAGRRAA